MAWIYTTGVCVFISVCKINYEGLENYLSIVHEGLLSL